VLSKQEEQELQRIVKATSERVDVVRRAKALLAVAGGQSFAGAARQAGLKSGYGASKLAKRFNEYGLEVLTIAVGRGRKLTYTSQQQALILAEVQREPDRKADQTATWSLMLLRQALRKKALPHISTETIRQVLHESGYSYQQNRTWCHTGYALRQRKSGTVRVYDPQTPEKKRWIEQAYEQAEAAGLVQLNEDEAGPYATRPQPGTSWQAEGHPKLQPQDYQRNGGAKLMTLLRPATGEVWAKGVTSVTNVVLHAWLKAQLWEVLAEIEKKQPRETLPPESQRPLYAQWETWLGHPSRNPSLPPLRILLVWDNLAGHLTPNLLEWLFEHGIMPLYTPLGGSWLNMAESVQRIIVRRALSGQYPQTQQQIIDWLEQTVTGWNEHPTPFVWNGKRRERRKRAKLRRLAGSGAATRICNSIAS